MYVCEIKINKVIINLSNKTKGLKNEYKLWFNQKVFWVRSR